MNPPTCRFCGVAEWRHVCRITTGTKKPAPPAAKPKKGARK